MGSSSESIRSPNDDGGGPLSAAATPPATAVWAGQQSAGDGSLWRRRRSPIDGNGRVAPTSPLRLNKSSAFAHGPSGRAAAVNERVDGITTAGRLHGGRDGAARVSRTQRCDGDAWTLPRDDGNFTVEVPIIGRAPSLPRQRGYPPPPTHPPLCLIYSE